MQRIVVGGTGLVGTALVNHWLTQGHAVTVVGRSKEKIAQLFKNQIIALEWNDLSSILFRKAEVVVNLAGAGIADKRWTAARKEIILRSRIEATKKIVHILTQLGKESPPLLNASAIGVYGLQKQMPQGLPLTLDEKTAIDWNNAPDFLSHVGREWEKATQPASQQGIRVVNMRFGVVLAKQGGALPQIIQPFYFFLGGKIGTGQQPFAWIAIDDLVRGIDFILHNSALSGAVNLVSPHCITQQELSKAIGKVLHKPSMMTTPAFLLKLIFGEMAHELLLEGQNVYPARLLEAGFHFSFSDIEPALQVLINNQKETLDE